MTDIQIDSQAASTACTLYYDGACPLCTAEMDKLGRLAGKSLQLRDIHQLEDAGADQPSRRELLEVLHYRAADGRLITGLEANVAAWQHTRYGLPWRLLLLPGIRQVAEFAYDRWALWRYRRLYGSTDPDSASREPS